MLATPERKFVQPHGLAVARNLVDTSSSAVYARILNPTDTTVKMNKGTPITLLTPIVEVGKTFNFEEPEVISPQKGGDDVSMDIPEHLKNMFAQGCQSLSEEQIVQFREFVLLLQENFAKPEEIGRTNFSSHKIKLKDDTPIKDAPRIIPVWKPEILDEEVKRLEERGLIEKSTSPWSAQTVLLRKKDGSWIIYVDYRELNEKTIKDAYPIPRIEDNLDALLGSY